MIRSRLLTGMQGVLAIVGLLALRAMGASLMLVGSLVVIATSATVLTVRSRRSSGRAKDHRG